MSSNSTDSTDSTGAQSKEPLRYRLITGPDDRSFCERISAALEDGYQLYGSPAATFNGETVIVAQAVILPNSSQ